MLILGINQTLSCKDEYVKCQFEEGMSVLKVERRFNQTSK